MGTGSGVAGGGTQLEFGYVGVWFGVVRSWCCRTVCMYAAVEGISQRYIGRYEVSILMFLLPPVSSSTRIRHIADSHPRKSRPHIHSASCCCVAVVRAKRKQSSCCCIVSSAKATLKLSLMYRTDLSYLYGQFSHQSTGSLNSSTCRNVCNYLYMYVNPCCRPSAILRHVPGQRLRVPHLVPAQAQPHQVPLRQEDHRAALHRQDHRRQGKEHRRRRRGYRRRQHGRG